MNWKEFRPTILFLVKFIGVYLVGNILYGFYVTSYGTRPDPATHLVTAQSAWVLTQAGWPTEVIDHTRVATTSIIMNGKAVVSVFEGCNGINVAIIFVAFLAGFGPYIRALSWFVPVGLLVIHVANLARIIMLFWVTLNFPRFLYFAHKYLFTAVIYAAVFAMWLIWVWRFALKRK